MKKSKAEKTMAGLGEFGLINYIKKSFSKKDKRVSVNIGDDAFCFKSGQENICVTKDMLVENVHFKTDWTSPYDLGKKCVEVNVSDLASMGNVNPAYAFIGLGAPQETKTEYILLPVTL